MKPEVAIYLSKVRRQFEVKPENKEYFLSFLTEEEFFSKLEEISEMKLETEGIPELTLEELELLRHDMFRDEYRYFKSKPGDENITINFNELQEAYMDFGGIIGYICLN